MLGSEDDVAFVFAVFIVNDDYGAAGSDSVHRGLHAVQNACSIGATRCNLLGGRSLGRASEGGQALHVFGERIGLKVHTVANLERAEVGCLQSFGNQADLKPCRALAGSGNRGDGQGHTRNSDGALLCEQGCQLGGQIETQGAPRLVGRDGGEGADRIHVTLHDVSVEAAAGGQATLQVDGVSGGQVAEVGAAQGLAHGVGAELTGLQLVKVYGGQADTVDGERAAVLAVGDDITGGEGQVGCVATLDGGDRFYGAEGANNSGKHVVSFSRRPPVVVIEGDGRRWFALRITIRIFRIFSVVECGTCQHANPVAFGETTEPASRCNR